MDETLKTILCYVLFFFYMALVMVVGELVRKKAKVDVEICRKGEHIATSAGWFICYFLTGATIHTVIINSIAFLMLTAVTFSGVMKSVEREDNDGKSYGLFYFGLSTLTVICIVVFVNPDLYILSGIPFYCLAIGDGFTPLIARLAKNHNIKLFKEKTLVGMATMFALSSLSALIFSLVFELNLSPLFIISIGALACVVELYSYNCTDNITVEFAVFGYLVLYYYGLVPDALQIALIVALPVIVLNGWKKALSDWANVISYIYFVLSVYFIGNSMTAAISALYVISAAVSIITVRIYNKRYGEKEKLARTAKQILANSGVALLACLLYHVTKLPVFTYAAFAVVTEEFADSMASDIGRLSKGKHVDIIGFKPLPAGISGGVSWLGTLSALIACAVALVIPFAFGVVNWLAYVILVLVCFVGVFIDSALGSRLQVLYRCAVCENLTEKTEHCETPTEYFKGVKRIDNSTVNFLSGVATALITVCVFSLITIL